MYCNNCGKHNPKGSKFCQHCGIKHSHTRSTKVTAYAVSDTFPSKTPKTKLMSVQIASWFIRILIIIILALSFWIINVYRQDVDNVLSMMQGIIEPSKSSNSSGWIRFDDPHRRFSAYLPVAPEVEKYTFVLQGESMTGHLYTSILNNDDSVEIAYMDDPNIVFDENANDTLDRLVNGFLININGIIIDGDYSTFLNYPSFEYRASAKKGKGTMYVKGLVFIKDNDIYMLNEYDTTGKFSSYEKLRNYFELN